MPVDDRAAYAKALIDGNHAAALAIERTHELEGYPPELVSVGLKAIAEGSDPHLAIDAYIGGDEPDITTPTTEH